MHRRNVAFVVLFVVVSLLVILKIGTAVEFSDDEVNPTRILSIYDTHHLKRQNGSTDANDQPSFTAGHHSSRFISSALRWTPQNVTAAASSSLVVAVGIPSTDTDVGAMRRTWQRNSWLRFVNVWPNTASSRKTGGTLVVNYLIGRHPDHHF